MMKHQSTHCVHTGTQVDANGGIITPIQPSTAYNYLDVTTYHYPRYFNVVNHSAVENKVAALEQAESAILFSSGMSATMSVLLGICQQGDHVLFQQDIYGGTQDSVTKELTKLGIEVSFSPSDAQSISTETRANTKIVFIESPSNPLLRITDIAAISALCKNRGLLSIIDNTFASPINQTPHALGIDIVLHSATKYLGGHSDISAGIATMSASLKEQIRETALHLGGNLDTQASWLLERSIKTLYLRVSQQNASAMRIAEFLEDQPSIDHVYYPGLISHPQHDLAKSQMRGFGGMLSFEINSDPDEFVKKLQLISPAMSLGGVESTITSPAQTSHARIGKEERIRLGISDNLLRLSVGIEYPDDLIEDLRQALT